MQCRNGNIYILVHIGEGLSSCSFAVLGGVWAVCVWLCCVLVPVLFGYTVAIYLALCGPLYIVAYDVWPYLGIELLFVLLVCRFFLGVMFVHFNHLAIFIVLSFHSYFIVVTFGWFAYLCLTALHSWIDLIRVLFVFGISLSWTAFLHFNNFVSFIEFSFYPYSLSVMLGGLTGLCHAALHLGTDLLWVYTTII